MIPLIHPAKNFDQNQNCYLHLGVCYCFIDSECVWSRHPLPRTLLLADWCPVRALKVSFIFAKYELTEATRYLQKLLSQFYNLLQVVSLNVGVMYFIQ